MIEQTHRKMFRHSGAFEAAGDGDPGAVKADVLEAGMFFADALKKSKPCQSIIPRLVERCPASLAFQAIEQGNQIGIEHGLVNAGFSFDANDPIRPVHVVSKVDMRFAHSDALAPRNVKRDGQKVRGFFILVSDGRQFAFFNFCQDHPHLIIGDFAFLTDGPRLNAETPTGVMGNPLSGNGFAHDDAKNFKVRDDSVDFDFAICFTPIDILIAVGPAKFLRAQHFHFPQKIRDGSPVFKVGLNGVGSRASGLDVAIHPTIEWMGMAALRDFFGVKFISKNQSSLPFPRRPDFESCGESLDFSGLGVSPFEPPKGAVVSFVNTSHRMCLNVPNSPKGVNGLRTETNTYKDNKSELYNISECFCLAVALIVRGFHKLCALVCLAQDRDCVGRVV